MTSEKYMSLCKEAVVEYFNNRVDTTNGKTITAEDVYIVWFCKSLQNFKVLASTTIADGMYYEITYNGDRNEYYLDAYKKLENVVTKLTDKESDNNGTDNN